MIFHLSNNKTTRQQLETIPFYHVFKAIAAVHKAKKKVFLKVEVIFVPSARRAQGTMLSCVRVRP